jgi:NhaP-type Na+/H+ or K+/H+ antiporter
MTLALVLFTDAAGADLGVLRRAKALPLRLLALGLPLSILLGYAVGSVLFGALSGLELALLATMLAPTDAALGEAVERNDAVPGRVRQALNVESGLNDGICVPILFLFLSLYVEDEGAGAPWRLGLELFAKGLGIGLASGVVLALLAVALLRRSAERDWLKTPWTKVTVIALALACFGTAQAFGGSGFIASFVGGLLFGALLKPHHERLLDAAEGVGDSFSLLTWVYFGAAAIGPAVGQLSWECLLYAVLSLTLIRMLPVYLVLSGQEVDRAGRLFIGWFGPRGLASIVFLVIVTGADVEHAGLISAVVTWTVILSIVAHGVTANPLARAYGARAGG